MTRKDIMKRPENQHAVTKSRSIYERRVVPPADIIDGINEYTVRVDMPGVNKDTIALKIDGDTLRVRGSAGDYHRQSPKMVINEISPTVYERDFHLGKDINRSNISGEYESGILTITLPKSEQAKPREIKIK